MREGLLIWTQRECKRTKEGKIVGIEYGIKFGIEEGKMIGTEDGIKLGIEEGKVIVTEDGVELGIKENEIVGTEGVVKLGIEKGKVIVTEDGVELGIEEGKVSKKKSDAARGKISWNIDVVSNREKNNVPFQKEKVGARGRQG